MQGRDAFPARGMTRLTHPKSPEESFKFSASYFCYAGVELIRWIPSYTSGLPKGPGRKEGNAGRYFSYAKPGRQGCRHGPRSHHQTHVRLQGGLVVQGGASVPVWDGRCLPVHLQPLENKDDECNSLLRPEVTWVCPSRQHVVSAKWPPTRILGNRWP